MRLKFMGLGIGKKKVRLPEPSTAETVDVKRAAFPTLSLLTLHKQENTHWIWKAPIADREPIVLLMC